MNAGGYRSKDAAIKALAKAGALIADFLGVDLSIGNGDGLETAIGFVGYRKTVETDVPLHLILHKELREAVWQTL
jgi:hypothetical protein